jgi:UDP-N-acetylmuramoyl-tripeptide--D-alanyl-D-alanine ligase
MTAALWTDKEAAQATGGTVSGASWKASGVMIDSRRVEPGDLFVALPGERVDGHDFVAAALAKGAAAALVERAPTNVGAEAPLLVVENVLQGLVGLAYAARARSGAKILGVTGSVGKTGTKEALSRALSVAGEAYVSAGNLNNHIGAPLSLARLPRTSEHAVLEMGMNHAGEIAPLSRMIRPHLAIVTNVAPVHIGFFDTERDIALAKAEIFEGLEPGGIAVLNIDNEWYPLLADRALECGADRIVSFGRDQGAEVRLIDARSDLDGSLVEANIAGRVVRYQLDAIGAHWAFNSIGVLACVHALGLDIEESAAAIRRVSAGRGRGGQVDIALAGGGSLRLIDESYNASPAAMRAAFSVMGLCGSRAEGRRIAVLGEMRELGEQGTDLHAGLADDLLAAAPERVYTVGPLMRALRARLPRSIRGEHGDVSTDIAARIASELLPGDVVLVKGSLGTNMAPIIAAIEALAEPRRLVANGR